MTLKDRVNDWLQSDDRAVSPVIGVILMVEITVILAAVIGTFVLDLGSSVGQSAPQVSLSIQDHTNDYDASTGGKAIKIAHDGGDDLVEGNFTIQVRNATDNGLQMEYTSSFATGDGTLLLNGNSISGGALVTTGDQLVIEDGANDILDDTRYKVIILDTESGDQIASATITVR